MGEQSTGGLVTAVSGESGDSKTVNLTEMTFYSNTFTDITNHVLDCTGANAFWVPATYFFPILQSEDNARKIVDLVDYIGKELEGPVLNTVIDDPSSF